MFGKVKRKIFDHLGYRLSNMSLNKHFSFKQDNRETAPFKLLFFSGRSGVNYLNASLVSVYNTWTSLPEVLIVTDGTPVSVFEESIIDWPKNKKIITWEECALHFANDGNKHLHKYACDQLWGKKMVSILYYAQQFPVLYSDTDILWYAYPKEIVLTTSPCIQMGEDLKAFYSNPMLRHLKEEKCLSTTPLNAGLIFANGDLSSYTGWNELCAYLSEFPDPWTEQTTFAILNNHFNPGRFWNKTKVLIKIDDRYSLRYTKKNFPDIFARHYVSDKDVSFWRDFVHMRLAKKSALINHSK